MNLTPDELTEVRRHNQRVKALGNGRAIVTWKDGKIEKTEIEASFIPDFYDGLQYTETHCQETESGQMEKPKAPRNITVHESDRS
jgi:methyl coenzyme M reductase subunit C